MMRSAQSIGIGLLAEGVLYWFLGRPALVAVRAGAIGEDPGRYVLALTAGLAVVACLLLIAGFLTGIAAPNSRAGHAAVTGLVIGAAVLLPGFVRHARTPQQVVENVVLLGAFVLVAGLGGCAAAVARHILGSSPDVIRAPTE